MTDETIQVSIVEEVINCSNTTETIDCSISEEITVASVEETISVSASDEVISVSVADEVLSSSAIDEPVEVAFSETILIEKPGGGSHIITDEGTSLTNRSKLNFTGDAVEAVDNPVSGATDVQINHQDISQKSDIGHGHTSSDISDFNSTVTSLSAISIKIVKSAGEPLSGHKVVIINSFNQAVYADSGNLSHASLLVGVTTNAASIGGDVWIVNTGEIVEPTWNWTIGVPIFLNGANGNLSQIQPTTGFSNIIGFPVTATSMFVKIDRPIILT